MEQVFVDTSAQFALVDKQYPDHTRAVALRRSIEQSGWQPVTTDYILDETATLILSRIGKARAIEYTQQIIAPDLQLVFVTDGDFYAAKNLFKKFKDKNWSFTDCVSFIVMKRLGITTAFSFDRHFTQAGFNLLK